MSKKLTDGEKFVKRWSDDFDIADTLMAVEIDKLIRRRQAEAWDTAIGTVERVRSYVVARRENPYLGRKK